MTKRGQAGKTLTSVLYRAVKASGGTWPLDLDNEVHQAVRLIVDAAAEAGRAAAAEQIEEMRRAERLTA